MSGLKNIMNQLNYKTHGGWRLIIKISNFQETDYDGRKIIQYSRNNVISSHMNGESQYEYS